MRYIRYRASVSLLATQVLHVAISPAQAWRSGGDIFPCNAQGNADNEATFSWKPTVGVNNKLFPVMTSVTTPSTQWSEGAAGAIVPMVPIAEETLQSAGYGRGAATGYVQFLGGMLKVDHITTKLEAGGRASHHSSVMEKSTIGWSAGVGLTTHRDSLTLEELVQTRGVSTEFISNGKMAYPILGCPDINFGYESPQYFGTAECYENTGGVDEMDQVGLGPEYVPGSAGMHCTKGFTEHFAFQPATGGSSAATVDIMLAYRVKAFDQPSSHGGVSKPTPGTLGPVKGADSAGADRVGAKMAQLKGHVESGGSLKPGKNLGVLSAIGTNSL